MRDTEEKTIAVLIPIFNVAEYLRQSLDSLLAQSYPHWIAYIMDDGSTDGSGHILAEYAENDSRFRVYHKENAGVAAARNDLLSIIEASGQAFEAVTFFDGDDWMEPETYAGMLKAMQDNQADIVFCGIRRVYPDKRVTEKAFLYGSGLLERTEFLAAVYSDEEWEQRNAAMGTVWNKFFRPWVIKGLRFPEDRGVTSDEPYCLQASMNAERFYLVAKPFFFYRQRAGSMIYEDHFHLRLLRSRLLSLQIARSLPDNERSKVNGSIHYGMLRTLRQIWSNDRFYLLYKYIDLQAECAEIVFPLAEKRHASGKLDDRVYRYLTELVSYGVQKDKNAIKENDIHDDGIIIKLLLQEIDQLQERRDFLQEQNVQLKNERTSLKKNIKNHENIEKKLVKEINEQKNKIEKFDKNITKNKQFLEKIREFRLGKYLKYRILSKFTIGKARHQYREKYQNQKELYRMIQNIK